MKCHVKLISTFIFFDMAYASWSTDFKMHVFRAYRSCFDKMTWITLSCTHIYSYIVCTIIYMYLDGFLIIFFLLNLLINSAFQVSLGCYCILQKVKEQPIRCSAKVWQCRNIVYVRIFKVIMISLFDIWSQEKLGSNVQM